MAEEPNSCELWRQQTGRGLAIWEQKVPNTHYCTGSDARRLWRKTGRQKEE